LRDWDPSSYLRFGDERTRPSVDLVHRIDLDSPSTVVDLGCGPGNSTAVLKRRWPSARVIGVDSSSAMIETARLTFPVDAWVHSDIREWSPNGSFDLVFSNAALQWVPNHGELVERLLGRVAAGGALAFQIPSSTYALVRTLIHEIALDGPWASKMNQPLHALTMEPPGFYYDHLAPQARSVDLWETEYIHVMESSAAIVEWIASTGLRPFLDALDSDSSREVFRTRLLERVADGYPSQADGRVLFPFRRTFVIAYAR